LRTFASGKRAAIWAAAEESAGTISPSKNGEVDRIGDVDNRLARQLHVDGVEHLVDGTKGECEDDDVAGDGVVESGRRAVDPFCQCFCLGPVSVDDLGARGARREYVGYHVSHGAGADDADGGHRRPLVKWVLITPVLHRNS